MLGKLSFTLALATAASAFKIEPRTLAQFAANENEKQENMLAQIAATQEPEVPDAADNTTEATDAGADDTTAEDADGAAGAGDEDADDTEDGAADGADDGADDTTGEVVDDAGTDTPAVEETDKPAGSVSVTATMGAVVALLVASAF